MKQPPTSEEKILAALAHGSVLFSFFGPIGPTIIWATQRKKSKYVTFHALQAMGYQAFSFWLWFFGMFFVAFGVIALSTILTILLENAGADTFALPFVLQPLIFIGIFGLIGLFFLIGIVGAVFCILDREFQYPLIGKWLRKKVLDEMNTEAGVEEWEDNWVSGICHSTAILQLWGIITPLIVWFTQKERSLKIRFQVLQAIFYQLIALIAYILGGLVYGLMIFMFIGVMLVAGTSGPAANSDQIPPWLGILFIVFIGCFLLFWAFFMIATPLYHTLAAIGSIRTIRGREFKYPILGTMLARKINDSN